MSQVHRMLLSHVRFFYQFFHKSGWCLVVRSSEHHLVLCKCTPTTPFVVTPVRLFPGKHPRYMSSTQHTNYLHMQPYPYPWLGWRVWLGRRVFIVEGPQTSRASHQQSPKEKTSKHFINALLLHEALKHDLHIINPMIAQILHAGDGLQVWGICRFDASKV